jgi:hypothetical protein
VTKPKVKVQKKPFVAPAPVSAPETTDMVTAKAARMALVALELVFQRLDRMSARIDALESELGTTLEIRRLLAQKDMALSLANECQMEAGKLIRTSVPHLPGFPCAN